MRALVMIAVAIFGAGCFDSIIDSPCIEGYELQAGTCVERVAEIDGGTDENADATVTDPPDAAPAVIDAIPDALTCTADLETDPYNCGACGQVCSTGLCSGGRCEGAYAGHIVVIGHDFAQSNGPMRRVLANAASLGIRGDLGIAHYAPEGTSSAASSTALQSGLQALGRAWHPVPLGAPSTLLTGEPIDVLVIDPRRGSGDEAAADGAAWSAVLDQFLRRGGTVIVLEGAGSVSYRFAAGAGLYTVTAPTVVSGTPAMIVDAADAVARHVPSPYLAMTVSVAYPGAPAPVVATPTGAPVVFHLTR